MRQVALLDLRNTDFFIRPIYLAQRLADFAHGRIGADAVDDEGHGVSLTDVAIGADHGLLSGSALQRVEAAADVVIVTSRPKGFQLLGLALAYGLVNVEGILLFLFDSKIVHADNDFLFGFNRALVLVRSFGNFLLRITVLDGPDHAAHGVETVKILESAFFHVQGELFHEVGTAQRVHGLGHAGFVSDDLLRAQGDTGSVGGGQRQGFIVGVGVQRLSTAQHRGQGLYGHAGNVVHGLLRGERDASGLSVEAHQPSALLFGAEAVFHQPVPDFARGAELGDLLEEIVVGIEEEAEPGTKVIHVQAAATSPLHVLHAVIDGECQLLQRRGTGFADVISADGNAVELGSELGSELESINHQPHGWRGRIDVFLLRDVFLENVVLKGAGNFLPVGPLLFRHHQIHGPQDRGRRVDGHGDRGLFQINAVEQYLHVFQRIYGHAAPADFAFAGRMVGVVAHQRRQIQRDRKPSSARG